MAACALDGDVEPVGSVVWPAGVAAISALERLSNARRGGLRGLSMLELGAGTGLTALAAAKFGARVVATDASELCLRLLRAARDANPDLSLAVEKLDFADVMPPSAAAVERARGPFDLVVACDTFYSTALAKATAARIAASRRRRGSCSTRAARRARNSWRSSSAWRSRAGTAAPTSPSALCQSTPARSASGDASGEQFRLRRLLCGRFWEPPPGPLFRCCIS